MLPPARQRPVTAYTPDTDPDRKLKQRIGDQIASGLNTYFQGLVGRLSAGIRKVGRAAKKDLPDFENYAEILGGEFWGNELKWLEKTLRGPVQDGVHESALQAANNLYLSSGVSFDPSVFNIYAADYALKYNDQVLTGINNTTQKGAGAIIARWIATKGATQIDLINAIQEAYLFSEKRARLVAVTESTRVFGIGNYLAGEELANILGMKPAVSLSDVNDLLPGHAQCRCSAFPEWRYSDSGDIAGLDYVWMFVNDAIANACVICAPRNGKFFSEILAEGL
jgi:hypothetical protein